MRAMTVKPYLKRIGRKPHRGVRGESPEISQSTLKNMRLTKSFSRQSSSESELRKMADWELEEERARTDALKDLASQYEDKTQLGYLALFAAIKETSLYHSSSFSEFA